MKTTLTASDGEGGRPAKATAKPNRPKEPAKMTATILNLPRQPLRQEFHDALDAALDTENTLHAAFYRGFAIGYAVAFGLVTREVLERARRVPFSKNVHLDFWQPPRFADEDSYWACGVRHGYSLGTSEQPDADECVLCGERITEADDYDSCMDGKFCGPDNCRHDWHRNGPSVCAMEGDDAS